MAYATECHKLSRKEAVVRQLSGMTRQMYGPQRDQGHRSQEEVERIVKQKQRQGKKCFRGRADRQPIHSRDTRGLKNPVKGSYNTDNVCRQAGTQREACRARESCRENLRQPKYDLTLASTKPSQDIIFSRTLRPIPRTKTWQERVRYLCLSQDTLCLGMESPRT